MNSYFYPKKKHSVLLILLWSFSFTLFSQPVAKTALSISKAVDSSHLEADAFLEKIVNVDSQTENSLGVQKVGNIFAKELQALGFHTYWEKMPASMHRAGNLFAIHQGTSAKKILLIGHLDTVFPLSASHRFQSLGHPYAAGIGVSDMKGGDVVLLEALKALQANDGLKRATLYVALMGDEENPGKPYAVARKELIKLAKQSDVVLDFESGPPSLGRRGVSTWQLVTTGRQQHSSLIFQPQVGAGAIYSLTRILNAYKEKFSSEDDLTLNVSLILGGTTVKLASSHYGSAAGKFNVVPKSAIALGDLRYISRQQKEATQHNMRLIANRLGPHTTSQLMFMDMLMPLTPTTQNKALFKHLQSLNALLTSQALVALPARLRGGGDISFIADEITTSLVGLGPLGRFEHALNEQVDLNSLHLATKRAALLIYSLTEANALQPEK